jgi:hypothetical protein
VANGETGGMGSSSSQQVSMLTILLAACETALNAFRAADNPIDVQLLEDLERMVERTRTELAALRGDGAR